MTYELLLSRSRGLSMAMEIIGNIPRPRRRPFCWGCVTLATAVLLLANWPAQEVMVPDLYRNGKYGPHFGCIMEGQHGWPLSYLRRRPVHLPGTLWSVRWSIWSLTEGVEAFYPLALGLDVVIAAAILAVTAFAAAAWRRARQSLFHLRLKELLAIIAVIAGASAWLHLQRKEYLGQQRLVEAITAKQAWGAHEEWQPGGPTWLRKLCGDRLFTWGDRVIAVRLDGDQLPMDEVSQLASLKVLGWSGTVSHNDVVKLQRLRHLAALDMYCGYFDLPDPPQTAEFWTDEDDAHATDSLFRHLAALTSLEGINFYDGIITGKGLAELSTLTNMRVLDLSDCDYVDDEGLAAVARMTKLEHLSLGGTNVTDVGIAHMANLTNLKVLYLPSLITDVGLKSLENLLHLRHLDASSQGVTDLSLPTLKRFKDLEYLNLDYTRITDAAVSDLKRALPNCRIVR